MTLPFNEKLKQTRKNCKLTIERLAKKAGCSKSYISQLEHGTTKPSVSMLGKLADALELPITDFFEDNRANKVKQDSTEKKSHKSIILNESLVKKNERRTINYPDGKTQSHFLTRAVYKNKMQPILTVIEPGGESNSSEEIVHAEGSEEFLMVLKGTLEFEINGETFLIEEGDSFYLNGDTPHYWRNNSTQTVEVLFMWTPAVW